MDLASFRKTRRLSQLQCARALGLSSKGYFSRIENRKQPISLKLALKIQEWSEGEVTAAEILPPDRAALLASAAPAPAGA